MIYRELRPSGRGRIDNVLEERNEHIALAMKVTQTGTWSWDIKTNQTYWSDENYLLLGYEPRQLTSNYENWEKCVHEDDLEEVKQQIQRALETKSGFDFVYRAVRPDGSFIWLQDIGEMLLNTQGEGIGMYGIQIDVSDRKRAEAKEKRLNEQLRQAQKMEAIGTLAGGIAHDFNNLLMPIIGYTEIINTQFADRPDVQSDLNKIQEAAFRAQALVVQILSFSRSTEENKAPLHIQSVVNEVLELLQSTIPTDIEIRGPLPEKERLVLADSIQIHQVVLNLCANACHAMRAKGGVLSLSTDEVQIQPNDETALALDLAAGSYIRLNIQDTGQGMDAETLKKIFDPYFTTKAKGEGTGLGLSVAHGIVRSMNGLIQVESQPGAGTTFSIYFPSLDIVVPDIIEKEQTPIPRGSERILLVDDDREVAELEQRILEKLGYRVTMTTNSQNALDRFASAPDYFDLIITDMNMPKLSGDALALKIFSIRPQMPILLCTGFSDRIDGEKAKSMGIRAFIMKPVRQEVLAQSVREALGAW